MSKENERICHLAHLSAIWHFYLALFALVLVLYAPLREEDPVQPRPALSERLQFSGEPQAPRLRVRTTLILLSGPAVPYDPGVFAVSSHDDSSSGMRWVNVAIMRLFSRLASRS